MTFGRITLAALACGSLTAAMAQAQAQVAIGHTVLGDNAAVFVAIDQGFFANHGIEATATALRNGAVIAPGLISDEIQIGTLTAPTFIQALDGGLPLQALSLLSETRAGDVTSGLLVREDSTAQGASDLAGQSLGVGTIGSIITVGTREWLRMNGVDSASVRLVESPMPQLGDLLRNGNVDFTMLPEPLLSRALAGGGLRQIASPFGDLPEHRAVMVAVVTRDWAEANPEAAHGAQMALQEATDWAIAHPEETMDIIARYLQIDPQIVRATGFPNLAAGTDAEPLEWWVPVMQSQDLLRTDVTFDEAIVR